ncbi:DUF1574 family protein [Pseudanabaena sp. FACHB-1998]|uniref:D-alanyl-lipoteichoic acid biosynthesis protein DltD n=1 Tax=Pseudanabaena sp. FACHB-1998 TaxID=2692858 RepID=UPI0016804ABA|nr:D-alanyl-lipoteichoic acid biosynthesis protein DltD [Pseudanabaena sp. FACHB-1998]MBD2178358.1 DUF1574 family protein [Pseudanabaena sp. FACHB-1998]
MEIISLDAKSSSIDSDPDLGEASSANVGLPIRPLVDIEENQQIQEQSQAQIQERQDSQIKVLSARLPDHLPESLSGLKLSHTKQKGDCLYLYSKDGDVNCATQILEAIAPSTQDLESSVLFAEGIRRLKLHGSLWALGVELPIAQSALVATEIIATLLTNFHQESKFAQTKLKLLLQNNCLNLLCESETPILQAEMALPMLDTLRNVRSAEYFQSVTVSNRVVGQKKPNWSFEIDLLAIGLPATNQEVVEPETFTDPSLDVDYEEESEAKPWLRLSDYIDPRLLGFVKGLIQLKWLGQSAPATFSLPACAASLAIGIGVSIWLDRNLNQFAQPNEPNKLVVADPKINVQDVATDKNAPNKPALNFNIALFNEKLALIDWQITNRKRSPDVLVVGSSRALRGIEPRTLENALISKGYKGIGVFNLGIDGATAKVVNIQLTQILSRPQLPRMIIWADGLRAFNSNRSDITYDEITASSGYKQVQENLKNNGLNPEPIPSNIAVNNSSPTPIVQALNGLFATASKRQEVRTSVVKSYDRATTVLSNSQALIASTMPNTVTSIDSKGFVAFDVTFDPNTYFLKYPQVPGDYDLDYRNFETTGAQFDAFANVVDFCRRNNVELLVVNMPLHATYLDPIRTRYEGTFNQRMEELALREGFTYLNLSQVLQTQAELFSDPSHLNHQGAIAMSKLLAQNPKIRWQILK